LKALIDIDICVTTFTIFWRIKMKLLALALALLIPSSVVTATPPHKNKRPHGVKMHDVTDLMQDTPHFDNAPRFRMDEALRGGRNLFGQPRGERRPKTKEMKAAELLNLLNELYGEDVTLTVATIGGKVIIFEKENKASAWPGRAKRDGEKPERNAKRDGSSREKYAELGRKIREAIANGEMTKEEGREKMAALRERLRKQSSTKGHPDRSRHDRNNKQ